MFDVSIVTPTLNYSEFLEDCLTSVRLSAKSTLRIEHIVADGGSTDGSVEILESASRTSTSDYSLVWFSEVDDGQSEALNRAYAHVTAPYVLWLNADEFLLPEGLEVLLEAAKDSGNRNLVVYGDTVVVDRAGTVIRLLPQHRYSEFALRHYGPYIQSGSTLIDRESINDDSPWDTDLHRVMDWDLWLKLRRRGSRFRYVPYPVSAFRIHERQVTAAPAGLLGAEHTAVRRRYRITARRPWATIVHKVARLHHAILKALARSYGRQRQAKNLVGCSSRWWTQEGSRAVASLKRIYDKSPSALATMRPGNARSTRKT